MHPTNPTLRQKGLKDYYVEIIDNDRVKKQYSYRKMIITWDSKKPLDKFYYWRHHFYGSVEATMRAIDRHYKHYKNTTND